MSEALRLADDLDTEFVSGRVSNHTARKAATELRRLASMEAELAALRAAVPAIPEGWRLVPVEPTPEMVDAYLAANLQYWKTADELPTPPNKWRTGTPNDATRESYRAMLAASPQAPQAACWCEACDLAQGHPMGRTRMSTCPQCGDKRCPRAKHHDSACSAPQAAQPRKPLFEDLIAQHPGFREELLEVAAQPTGAVLNTGDQR